MTRLATDCLGWEASEQQRKHAEEIADFPTVDYWERMMQLQAVSVLADPRRLVAVQGACPQYEAEMRAKAASSSAPAIVANPAFSPTAAAQWAQSLTDEELKTMKDFIGAETKRRNAKKR